MCPRGYRFRSHRSSASTIALQVGSAAESITVEAQAPLLKTENAEQSVNVTGGSHQPAAHLILAVEAAAPERFGVHTLSTFSRPAVQGSGNSAVIKRSAPVQLQGDDRRPKLHERHDTNWTATVTRPAST